MYSSYLRPLLAGKAIHAAPSPNRIYGGIDMKLLLIEDDISLCQILKRQFQNENIETVICHTGNNGMKEAHAQKFDIIILDCMLPDKNGIDILKQFLFDKISTPVIMLTALGTLQDKLNGLENGADDYIVKPFEFDELLARIHSVLRRSDRIANTDYNYGDITYNIESHEMKCGTEIVQLSQKEAQVFEILVREAGKFIAKDTIIDYVWGEDSYIDSGNLGNYIYFLRNRLKSIHSKVTIKTAHGTGYALFFGDLND